MYIWNESKESGLLLVAMTYHSIVILGQPCCLLQFWLRSPSIMALINKITPIPYSSSTILIKSQKIYNKGRLLHGHDHKFVRMRRTGAIPHVKVDAASFQPTSPRHYTSAKNAWYRSNLYTTKQFPMPQHMQVGGKAKGSLESMRVLSQSVPIGPIAGQKIDLHERQQCFCLPKLSNLSTISKMGCFFTFPYIHMMAPKHYVGGWDPLRHELFQNLVQNR